MNTTRRNFIKSVGAATALSPLGGVVADEAKHAFGKAESCIFIWLGGGACQVDTWDPKVRGDAKKRIPGSYYDSIPTACERCASLRALASNGKVARPLRTVALSTPQCR